jgi:uncharacterized protein (TIGR00106 family)
MNRPEKKEMSTIIDFSIFPLDKGESVSRYVMRAVSIISKSGLPFTVGPMGTSIEGDWEEVMAVVNSCFESLKTDSDRIILTLKADYRKGTSYRMDKKVLSVKEALGVGQQTA